MTTPKLINAKQVAERLGISTASVYQMSYLGRLPGKVKIGTRVRWREDVIDKIVEHGLDAAG